MDPSAPDEPEKEISEGGSELLRYEDGFNKPTFGFTAESKAEFMQQREAAYAKMFGKCESVSHEVMPLVPHIDVYICPPTDQRSFYTLITGGMSDLRMTLPPQVPSEYARVELILYCEEPKSDYVELMRTLAHFPHDNKTWLGPGHTMPNGNPPQPMFGNDNLDSFLFIPSIARPDNQLGERLKLDGDPVNPLCLVPVSTAECDHKLKHGINAFYDVLDKNDHPLVLNEERKSYI